MVNKDSDDYKFGVQVGILAACNIISKKLNDPSKSFMDRISDAKTFCANPYSLIGKVKENKNKKDKKK